MSVPDKCKKHPNYKAILKPRADCDVCFELYRQRQWNHVCGPNCGACKKTGGVG